jgi:Uma2 family endonuclease
VQAFGIHVDDHGGDVFAGCNVDPAPGDHVEPDVVALAVGYNRPIDESSVRAAPSLVIEVSSPSTRSYGLADRRALYERHGVRPRSETVTAAR